jgi:hypothetical protein
MPTNRLREYGFETITDMEAAVKQWLLELDTGFCGYRVHQLIVQYLSPRGLFRNMIYEVCSDEFEMSFMNHKFIFWQSLLFCCKIKKIVK